MKTLKGNGPENTIFNGATVTAGTYTNIDSTGTAT